MTFYRVTDPAGRVWEFDPDGIYSIVRGAIRAQIVRRRSRVVENSAGLFLPTTYNLETNWSGFRAELDRQAALHWEETEMSLRTNAHVCFGDLMGLVNAAINDQNWYLRQNRSCAERSENSISGVVRNWEIATAGMRLVRDGSATVLVVTAGVVMAPAGAAIAGTAGMTGVSMGTATTTLAAGSVMRGAFTYQDSGNVGSAIINAGGTFTVGMIGLGTAGAGLTQAQQGVVLAISSGGAGATASGQAIVEGQNMRQVAMAGITAAGGQALGGVLGTRIENLGFVSQLSIAGTADLAVGRASSAAVDRLGASPSQPPGRRVPATRGRVDFLGLPSSSPTDFVRRYALRVACA